MRREKTAGATRAVHWLNPARLRLYSALILLVQLTFWLHAAWSSWKRTGQPGGVDFPTFWTASRLWREGTPLDAYSYTALVSAAHRLSPLLPTPGPFFYPPTYFLLLKPLAFVPCSVATLVFLIASAAVFVLLLRKVLPARAALLPILAFPGVWLNMAQGQNACLTASLALGTLLMLERRPVLAGICLGLLSIKPHLAILFPIALACAGMWTTFAVAGITTLVFTGVSILVFGPAVIPAFLHGIGYANNTLASGVRPWALSASLFAGLRDLHVAVTPAYMAQGFQSIVAAVAVIWVWRRTRDLCVRATALVAGTCMISPFIFNYDTAWLGIAIAMFTAKALRDGWLRGERAVLCMAWFYPPFGNLISGFWHVGVGPLVFAAVMYLAIRRAYRQNDIALEKSQPVLNARAV